jgi:hypothetical protein
MSSQISSTQRSSVEQRLLVRSFERALATLDTQEFKGKTVVVDFYGLTSDKDFMKEFFTRIKYLKRTPAQFDFCKTNPLYTS